MKRLANSKIFYVFIIAVVATLAYLNTLHNGFIFDDHSLIEDNTLIRSFKNLPYMFTMDIHAFEKDAAVTDYYRPVLYLLYTLEYFMFGLETIGWRFVNIVIHALSSILVFLTGARLLAQTTDGATLRSGAGGAERGGLGPKTCALIAGLVFAVHPINTEAVTTIGELGYAFFYLLSFYFYVLYMSGRYIDNADTERRGAGARLSLYYALALLTAVISIFTKETAVTILAILLAYDFSIKRIRRTPFKRHIPFLAAAIAYVALRSYALHGVGISKPIMHDPFYYFTTVFKAIAAYLWMLVLPVNLSMFRVMSTPSSILDARLLLSIATVVIFLVAVWRLSKVVPAVLLYAALIVVPLMPTMYLVVVDKNITILAVIAERYLYIPMAGFSMLVALGLQRLDRTFNSKKSSAVLVAVTIVILGLYTAGTVRRNSFWKDDFTIWNKTMADHPNNYFAHYMIGDMYDNELRTDLAIEKYQKSIELNPDFVGAHYRLGLIYYYLEKMPEKAEHEFLEVLRVHPKNSDAAYELARIYMDRGWWDRSIRTLEAMLKHAGVRRKIAMLNALAVSYASVGRTEDARERLVEAYALDPNHSNTRENLLQVEGKGQGYWRLGGAL